MDRREWLRRSTLALLGVLGTRGEAVAGAAAPLVGLNAQPPLPATQIAHLRALGVRHVRLSAWWAWYQPAEWDGMMQRARAAGIEVLPLITAPPKRLDGASPSALADALSDFTLRLLDRHGPFPYVQIGNEWDAGSPWFGPESGQANGERRGERYGDFMERVARRLRAAHPRTRIVTMGIVHTQDFVRGMYRTGAGAWDVVAIHTYGDHVWGEPWSRGRNVRAAQSAHDRSEPVWVTEFGISGAWQAQIWKREHKRWPSREEMDRYHLDNWRIPLSEDPSRSLYQRVYGFQLPSDPDKFLETVYPGESADFSFGLVRSDQRTPRPAYRWLQQHLNG